MRPPAWALLPALAVLVGSILLGTAQPAAPLVEGLAFAAVAVVWLALRHAWDGDRAAVRAQTVAHALARLVQRLQGPAEA